MEEVVSVESARSSREAFAASPPRKAVSTTAGRLPAPRDRWDHRGRSSLTSLRRGSEPARPSRLWADWNVRPRSSYVVPCAC